MPSTGSPEQLTPEQAAILHAVRDEWLGIALATGPADRPAAEYGVRLAYERAGLAPPRTVIWLDSPLRGAYAIAMIELLRAARGREPDQEDVVSSRLAERVRDPLWNEVWDQIRPQGLGDVGEAVLMRVSGEPLQRIFDIIYRFQSEALRRLEADVSYLIYNRAWVQVGSHIQRRMADHLGPKVWADVWPELRDRFGGHVLLYDLLRNYSLEEFFVRVPREVSQQRWHHEWEAPFQTNVPQQSAGGLAGYDGLVRLGVDVGAPLDGLVRIARSAGWWFPLEHAVILTERPTVVHLDSRGRLHQRHGPAITYPDGFAVHARHGTVVPGPIIHAGRPTRSYTSTQSGG